MNNLLELKGKFDQKKRNGRIGARNLPRKDSIVETEHLSNLLSQLKQIYQNFDIASVMRDAVGAYSWKTKDGLWAAISGMSTEYAK